MYSLLEYSIGSRFLEWFIVTSSTFNIEIICVAYPINMLIKNLQNNLINFKLNFSFFIITDTLILLDIDDNNE